MSSQWLVRLAFGVFGVLLIGFMVIDSPKFAWSLVPIAGPSLWMCEAGWSDPVRDVAAGSVRAMMVLAGRV